MIYAFQPATETVFPVTTPELDTSTTPDGLTLLDECPSWSPDAASHQFAFLSMRRDGAYAGTYGELHARTAIYMAGVDGQSAPVRLALAPDGTSFGCPLWTSLEGNTRIIVPVNDDNDYFSRSLSMIDTVTGSVTPLVPKTTGLDFGENALSPDGTRVAYRVSGADSNYSYVHVFDLETGVDRTVTEGWYLRSYSWNPDGTQLAVYGQMQGQFQIGIVDTSQSCAPCAVRLLSAPGPAYEPTWSPDGNWIAVTVLEASTRYRLALLAVDGSEVLSLYTTVENPADKAWNPVVAVACTPADPNALMAFSSAGVDYCIPQPTPEPTPEPCMGYPVESVANVRREPSITAEQFEWIQEEGRPLLARLSTGTSGLWDDWYLVSVVKEDGGKELGWARADVVYTSPRYGDACMLPISDQEEILLDPEQRQLLEVWGPTLEGNVGHADPLFDQSTHEELRLPAPFTAMPYLENAAIEFRFSNGYGLTSFAYQHPHYYEETNHIHSGLDFFATDPLSAPGCAQPGRCFRVAAICDGRVTSSETISTGGRFSLRCDAPDGSPSHLYVSYSHLRNLEGLVDEHVVAGADMGAQVYQYPGNGDPHLHLELLYAPDGDPNTSIRINPLLFFSTASGPANASSPYDSIHLAMKSYYPRAGNGRAFEAEPPDRIDPTDVQAQPYDAVSFNNGNLGVNPETLDAEDLDLGLLEGEIHEFTLVGDYVETASGGDAICSPFVWSRTDLQVVFRYRIEPPANCPPTPGLQNMPESPDTAYDGIEWLSERWILDSWTLRDALHGH